MAAVSDTVLAFTWAQAAGSVPEKNIFAGAATADYGSCYQSQEDECHVGTDEGINVSRHRPSVQLFICCWLCIFLFLASVLILSVLSEPCWMLSSFSYAIIDFSISPLDELSIESRDIVSFNSTFSRFYNRTIPEYTPLSAINWE